MENYEAIISFIKSEIVLLGIPLYFLKRRVTKYDKALIIINELSTILVRRLNDKMFVSRHEIESLIKSKCIESKLPFTIIKIDNVLDSMVKIIEESAFVTLENRRFLLERIISLRTNDRSLKLRIYRYIKDNEASIYISSLLLVSIWILFKPHNWQLFSFLNLSSNFLSDLGTSLIFLLLILFLSRIIYWLRNQGIHWGSIPLSQSAFGYLPKYYEEKLLFKVNDKIIDFKLSNVEYLNEDNVVETDPGILWFIWKAYKKHQTYSLEFIDNNRLLKLKITISTHSFGNGSIDVEQIEYKLFKKDINKMDVELNSLLVQIGGRLLSSKVLYGNYTLGEFQDINNCYLSPIINNTQIILDEKRNFMAFDFENVVYSLIQK